LANGWTLGEIKDIENKISPSLIPYDELSEEVKNLDRDSIRNIPRLLEKIGMGVYVRKKDNTSPYDTPLMIRRLPDSYKD
jgi:hypothetical protein